MPSFLPSAHFHSARLFVDQERHAARNVVQKAQEVINECRSTIVGNDLDRKFVDKLSEYLQKRSREIHLFSFNNSQIDKRTQFIQNFIAAVKGNNVSAQMNLLSEKHIRGFKGYFSQRLYDILVERRNELLSSNPSMKASKIILR